MKNVGNSINDVKDLLYMCALKNKVRKVSYNDLRLDKVDIGVDTADLNEVVTAIGVDTVDINDYDYINNKIAELNKSNQENLCERKVREAFCEMRKQAKLGSISQSSSSETSSSTSSPEVSSEHNSQSTKDNKADILNFFRKMLEDKGRTKDHIDYTLSIFGEMIDLGICTNIDVSKFNALEHAEHLYAGMEGGILGELVGQLFEAIVDPSMH